MIISKFNSTLNVTVKQDNPEKANTSTSTHSSEYTSTSSTDLNEVNQYQLKENIFYIIKFSRMPKKQKQTNLMRPLQQKL